MGKKYTYAGEAVESLKRDIKSIKPEELGELGDIIEATAAEAVHREELEAAAGAFLDLFEKWAQDHPEEAAKLSDRIRDTEQNPREAERFLSDAPEPIRTEAAKLSAEWQRLAPADEHTRYFIENSRKYLNFVKENEKALATLTNRNTPEGKAAFLKIIEGITTNTLETAAELAEKEGQSETAAACRELSKQWDTMTLDEKDAAMMNLRLPVLLSLFNIVAPQTDPEESTAEGGHFSDTPGDPLPSSYAHNLPGSISTRLERHLFTLSKVINKTFLEIASAGADGQTRLSFDMGYTDETGEDLPVLLTVDYNNLPEDIKKRLTPFDRRVMCTYATLMRAQKVKDIRDYKAISTKNICQNMGLNGNPSQRKRVQRSLEKMSAIRINLILEATDKGLDFAYHGYFLPLYWEEVTTKKGTIIKDAVHPLVTEDKPNPAPFVDFADKTGQLTTVKREILESPLSLTDDNIAVEDYIIERVKHYEHTPTTKNGNIILTSTIFDRCGITSKSQITKLRERIDKELLPHYEATGFLTVTPGSRQYIDPENKKGLLRFEFSPGSTAQNNPEGRKMET